MPGICGFLARGLAEERAAVLQRMSGALTGRAGSESGVQEESGLELGVAWKTGEGVFRHCGPTWNRDRSICLVLAGEVFGAGEEADRQGEGDTAGRLGRWLAAYEQKGWGVLEWLNGSFAGVLIDLRQRCVGLFSDRFGLGRLYCHESPKGVWFATEAKALLAGRAELRRLDEGSVGEWLSCGCVLQHRTLFAGVELLPPGAVWVLTGPEAVAKRRYFEAKRWEAQPVLSQAEYYGRLRETFPRVLERYFQGREPVAMSLTGGLDGRMIMAWSRGRGGQVPCYTFNGPVRDCADVRLARRIASACGQTHHTIAVGDGFLQQFPALAAEAVELTDGAMDVTGAVELYVNRLAREIAPVRLTGNYGSEILRRYVAFRPRGFPAELLAPPMQGHVRRAAATYAAESGGERLSFIAFKQVPWHHFARYAVERAEIAVRSPFLDNELVGLAFQAPPSATGLELCLELIAAGNPALGRIPTDRGVVHPAGGVGNRMRREKAEFLAKAEYAYDYGMPHWLARVDSHLGALRLERLFLGRQKFCHFRSWYRGPLGSYVRQVLLDGRSLRRPYLEGRAVERMVEAHVGGRENWTVEIHKLLSLELLQRGVLERA